MNNGGFFILNSDVLLVKGAKRGAIYDLNSGSVYSIDGESCKIIEGLDSGIPLAEVIKANSEIGEVEIEDYLKRLNERGLGIWMNVYDDPGLSAEKEILRYVLHLELTTGCNLRRLHCYNESGASDSKKELSSEHWKKVIKEAYDMKCRRLQFIGGEPFLRRGLLYELISCASELGYASLEVSSNGTLISDSDLEFLIKYKTGLALSFYSYQPQIHDLITVQEGSWEKTLKAIKRSLEFGVNLRISVVAMKQNEQDIGKTVGFLYSQGVKIIKSTAVEPVGRGCGKNLFSASIGKKQVQSKPIFTRITSNVFWRNRNGHNCFLEQICVGADGSVYPCLAERKMSYGNIKFFSLNEILRSETALVLRHLSKDHIEVCRDCEYRYCCFDCRVKASDFLDKDSHKKPWWCSYNPYTGKWTPDNEKRR